MSKNNDWDARSFKPGEIVEASFTYSARFPYFFVITRNSGKSVWAKELGQRVVTDDGYGQNGTVMPNEREVVGEEIMGRIDKQGYVKLNGNTARRWDGLPSAYYSD